METRFHRRGLPKCMRRILGQNNGVIVAADLVLSDGEIPVKTVIFETRDHMRQAYDVLRVRGVTSGRALQKKCTGCALMMQIDLRNDAGEIIGRVVDRNYFAVVFLVEGFLTQMHLTHESVHVGHAHAARHGKDSRWRKKFPTLPEEWVAYPAGLWADRVVFHLCERYSLRIIGGDGIRARRKAALEKLTHEPTPTTTLAR